MCVWASQLTADHCVQAAVLGVLIAWQVFDALEIKNNPQGIAVMYCIAGAWGLGDAAFNSVISTMLGVFYPPEVPDSATEAAFANMRFWSSLFTGLCFFGLSPLRRNTSESTSIAVELCVPLGMIVAASVGLVVLWSRRRTPVTPSDDLGGQSGARRSSMGSFQGVFFGVFMSTFISGDALSGAILGADKHPSQHRVTELFLVYVGVAFAGFLIIVVFLRRHSSGAPLSSSSSTN